MKLNKNIIISIITIIFLLSALIYNLLYINNKKNEIKKEIETSEFLEISEENNKKTIYVHVAGTVDTPGLYELPEGARVNDAISIAGGVLEDADLTDVNLAYVLSDSMKIYIPKKEEKKEVKKEKKSIISTGIKIKEEDSNLININTATKEQLQELSGIGKTMADRIIEYRESNGNFKNIEELKNVSGIGESKYNKIASKITI